ncbi:MAG: ABC transporter ATP-binding protein [Candidatus Caldarchaeum sp.]|nr:ABC transporter ATP-binding protein [Candidatus Caldarchaeum sp.]MDW8063368.1 ABC transporter ATP-binding protein [Candidatus Caldarchaeum sp.]MDW8435922.1 ABC transporter ATP-binding protein [Candidatus Caldarchaeum sp.]
MLQLVQVSKSFGGLKAVNNVSMEVPPNLVMGLIGPNGSGKSTLVNIITGFYRPDSGDIFFKGEKITGRRPYYIANKGIVRTFQLTRVFKNLTVLQNLMTASSDKERDKARIAQIIDLLNFNGRENTTADSLSYGEQKLLEIGRALVKDPEMLILDEPASGISPMIVDRLTHLIKDLKKIGRTILVIEHNLNVISRICDRVVVLNHGQKIAEGSFSEISRDQNVITAYLGE